MLIKFLSNTTISRIAAGEVIERPASVIKELVENSIDAGSDNIDITIENAGKNLIIIADNGCGMSPQNLEIAVQRHTTSKLDESDLLNIHTFGFRGEALPSIGSISRMTVTSKAASSDKAYQIQVIGGEVLSSKPAVHNDGTTIEIRDLFFATPARLKFLRSDKTELAACVEVVKKIALSHPGTSFTLQHNGKNIFKVRKQDGARENQIKGRIVEILGEDFINNAAIIDLNNSDLVVKGYTSIPTLNKATKDEQFLFINNRPVKDSLLYISLRVAYQDYLARDRHPYSVIFLEISPHFVDVNVHPAKSEVRFHDPNMVKNFIIHAIKNALSENSQRVSSTIGTTALGFFNSNNSNGTFNSSQQAAPSHNNYGNYKNFAENAHVSNFSSLKQNKEPIFQDNIFSSKIAPNAKIEEEIILSSNENINFRLGAAKAQFHSTYIISQTNDSIIIIDQHAAHERLGYEKIKENIKRNSLIKQRLLIPEIIELSTDHKAELLYRKSAELSEMGLTIEKFGEKSIIVSETPSLLGDINVKDLILDLADYISEIGENIKLTELIEHVTETYACHYSVRAGRVLNTHEMNELLRQMEQTSFSGQCNHGRPTYIELKLKDIEKLFGRI